MMIFAFAAIDDSDAIFAAFHAAADAAFFTLFFFFYASFFVFFACFMLFRLLMIHGVSANITVYAIFHTLPPF